jgi:hypothetical protein
MTEAWGFTTDGDERNMTEPVPDGVPPLRSAGVTAVAIVPGCDRCGVPKAAPTEHVDGRAGWKCHVCAWWSWIGGESMSGKEEGGLVGPAGEPSSSEPPVAPGGREGARGEDDEPERTPEDEEVEAEKDAGLP